jgi:hypothetical protein
MTALGMPVHDPQLETTVYLHLESWGIGDFTSLTPIIRTVLGGWNIDLDASLSNGPRGCAPTLLALSTSAGRSRLAVYFKPALAKAVIRRMPSATAVAH